uniref:Sulfatase N-terminal domain-containing protein n=1 Tax=Strigamia maritima TaxID=126957 RepID=T1J5S5_STRMM
MKLLLTCLSLILPTPMSINGQRPNFILFMADDLGYGDISCFGNKTLATPNIDQLASQGVRLTHTVAASAICTPSRSAFLTGRLPIRYGLVGNEIPVITHVASKIGLPQSELTFAKILQQNGYATSVIGKWHQGLDCNWHGDKCHHPHTHGFHHFYGTPLTNQLEYGDEDEEVYTALLIYPNLFTYFKSVAFVSFLTAVVVWRLGYRLTSFAIASIGIGIPAYFYFTIVMNKPLNSMIMRNDQVTEQPIILKTFTKRMVRESLEYIHEQSKEKNHFYFSSASLTFTLL